VTDSSYEALDAPQPRLDFAFRFKCATRGRSNQVTHQGGHPDPLTAAREHTENAARSFHATFCSGVAR
jgi:hypothetical protein